MSQDEINFLVESEPLEILLIPLLPIPDLMKKEFMGFVQ
jgi:hypothetical protein